MCEELYDYQVSRGRHFHLEQPVGSEALKQSELNRTVNGTLRTVFDMCEVGALKVPGRTEHMKKRTVIHTTSRTFHESLDARFCRKNHDHIPIQGKIKYMGKWISLSEVAAHYTLGFAWNVVKLLECQKLEKEWPLELDELCVGVDGLEKGDSILAALEVVKRRRINWDVKAGTASKSSSAEEQIHKRPRIARLKEIFKDVDALLPRVGTIVLPPGSDVMQKISVFCDHMKTRHVEACRGTDRYRVPKSGTDVSSLPLRQTLILNRETGEVEQVGGCERWQRLAKRQQIRKGKPARISITVFGEDVGGPGNSEESEMPVPKVTESRTRQDKRSVEDEGLGERPSKQAREEVDGFDVPVQGFPPRITPRHGPCFLELNESEKKWLKQTHHRMGHPDPKRFGVFLRDTGAEEHLVKGALDMQCDTCLESQKGFQASRPAAIHDHVDFNQVLGVDVCVWTSQKGERFVFVHCVDEGTHFQQARPCKEDAESQISALEDMWISWAGAPTILYTDPAKEYCSYTWLTWLQKFDICPKMTATDSHWQLGRAESHGAALKAMLTRMDVESPIVDARSFKEALVQAVTATAKNTLSRVKGFSPEQAVLGRASRLPASILSDEHAGSHSLAEAQDSEGDVFRQHLEVRQRARKAFVETDNTGSLRRALLRRVRPLRDGYEIGDWVLYWKRTGGNLRRERGRWYGPARVVLCEGHKVLWLAHAHRLIRASPEQVRPASLREWKAIPQTEIQAPSQGWLSRVGQGEFLDLGDYEDPANLPDDSPQRMISEGIMSQPEPERETIEGDASPRKMSLVSERDLETNENERCHIGDDFPYSPEQDGVDVPVPEEDEDDLLFGDVFDFDSGIEKHVWEVDVSPPVCEKTLISECKQIGEDQIIADQVVLMAADMRKKRVEVKLKELNTEDQHRFAVAKHKECGAWLSHKTVTKVAKGQIPEHAIMRCRWLLVWKSPSGNEEPGDLNAEGKRAKARIVVIGYEDPDIGEIPQDAPTLTKDGRGAVLQMVSSCGWSLISFDISTAFLHGKGDGRVLGLHPTPEIREMLQMGEDDQCKLEGGAYGRVDAPFL